MASILEAIIAINSSAQASVDDEDYNKITWLNDTTPISEADIKSSILEDKFIVINLVKGQEYFNVRYQVKSFMIWIWLSTLILIIGGFTSFIKKYK